ncbi:MAG: hypothetical protein AAB295_12125, partial [Chloroflexota bacterium]
MLGFGRSISVGLAGWLWADLLLGLFAVMVVSRRRPSVPEAMLFVVFAAFALYAARNVPLFAIVAAPAL